MPRKLFRKYLPSYHTVCENRYIGRLGSWLHHHNLWHLHKRSVAGAVAVGMFAGLVPGSNPVQFLAAVLLAVLFKVNLPIAVLVTLYSNPFTVVPLYVAAFALGQFVLREQGGSLPSMAFSFGDRGWREWLPAVIDWCAALGKPLLVGLPLLALLLSVLGYIATRAYWRWHVAHAWQRRRKMRAPGEDPS